YDLWRHSGKEHSTAVEGNLPLACCSVAGGRETSGSANLCRRCRQMRCRGCAKTMELLSRNSHCRPGGNPLAQNGGGAYERDGMPACCCPRTFVSTHRISETTCVYGNFSSLRSRHSSSL